MIKGLRTASIWSEDLNNLLPFYRDTMGLKPSLETPGFVMFGDQSGAVLALGTHSEVKGKTKEPARHMVGFECADIHGYCVRLKAAGVEFIEELNKQPFGWIATIKDPEGNLLQLMQGEK
jgi:predicted enzyme related to lactoylglutathione lyase